MSCGDQISCLQNEIKEVTIKKYKDQISCLQNKIKEVTMLKKQRSNIMSTK